MKFNCPEHIRNVSPRAGNSAAYRSANLAHPPTREIRKTIPVQNSGNTTRKAAMMARVIANSLNDVALLKCMRGRMPFITPSRSFCHCLPNSCKN